MPKKKQKPPAIKIPVQKCPLCGRKISALPGTRDAICQNCGYKDPCCE